MGTYTTLLSDVPAWMDYQEQDLTDNLPTAIANAELRLARDIKNQAFLTVTTGTLSTAFVDRPADLLAPRTLQITVSGSLVPLEYKELEWLETIYPDPTVTGQPVYYAVYDASTYKTGPTTGTSLSYTLKYKQRLAALSASNSSNWLTVNAYDALLAASCLEGCYFVQDDRQTSMIEKWERYYAQRIAGVNGLEMEARQDADRVAYHKPPREG